MLLVVAFVFFFLKPRSSSSSNTKEASIDGDYVVVQMSVSRFPEVFIVRKIKNRKSTRAMKLSVNHCQHYGLAHLGI